MQKKFGDIVKNMYSNPWWKAFWGFVICFLLYMTRKNIIISEETLTIINMSLVMFLLIALHQIVKKKEYPVVRICFVVIGGFIMNQYYMSDIFLHQFHIELVDFCWVFAIGTIIIILAPLFMKVLIKIVMVLSDVVQQCVEVDKSKREKKEQIRSEKIKQKEQKRNSYPKFSVAQNRTNEVQEKAQELKKEKANKNEDKTSRTVIENENAVVNKNSYIKSEQFQKEERMIFSHRVVYVAILLVIVLFPAFFVSTSLNEEWLGTISSIDTAGVINIGISLMSLIIVGIFIWSVTIGLILKLVRIVFDILVNKNEKSYYLVYIGAFFLLSFYLCKEYDYTIDDVADTIAEGDIFSYPLFVVILMPVFLTFLDNFRKYIAGMPHIKEEIVKMIRDIAFGIVISLLKYIKFVTADFLSSVGAIVEGDLNDEGTEKMVEKTIRNNSEEIGRKKEGEPTSE